MQPYPAGQKSRLTIYLLVAFLFSAIFWLYPLVVAQNKGYTLPTAANTFSLLENGYQNNEHRLTGIIFSAATYGPLLGALIAIGLESGLGGLKSIFQRIVRWRVHWKWYLAVVAITLGITTIPGIFGGTAGSGSTLAQLFATPGTFFLLLFLRQLLTSGLGEEVGWRGYLLPKLQGRINGGKVIWINGIIWALWHFPFVIYLFWINMGTFDIGVRIPMVLLSLAGFTMTIIGQTHIYFWLMKNTGSVWIAILYHALGNTFATIFGAEEMASGPLAILPAIMPWVVVFILEKRYGKESFQ